MDPRDLPSNRYGIDINKIDPKWIENCKSVKKLRAAVRTLKEDGYYPDLTKMAEDKLCQLDPEYKRRKELPHATAEEKQEAEKELNDFLAEIAKPQDHSDEKRKLEEAKKERLKGNECMAGQEYKEAVRYYEKSLKLDPNEAATYSNRALAYLKLNDYKNALNDANAAIDLMPEYLKAYHRRAEAFLGLGEYAKAYSDVKAILLVEPQNAAAKETKEKLFKKIKTAKVELDEEKTDKAAENIIKRIKEPKPQPTEKKPEVSKKAEPEEAKQEKTKDGFVKVAISEDASDSSESEEEPSKPVPEKPKQPEKIWSEEEIKPAKPEPEPTAVPAELDKIFATYNFHKEEGNKLHKSGQYDEAIKRYLQALSHMESIKPPKVSQDEYTKREAVVNSNIAVCYKQMQDSSNVIHYATKVINSKVDDTKVLLKALVLRAYAYESVDKLLQAKEDWTKVKELQWDNMDASRALERINEAVKREKSQRIGDTLNSIQKKLEECKTAGNNYYKVGEHLKAIEQFSNGIELFLEKCDVESMQYTPKDLMQIVCQLYTNRAICNHVLNRHLDVIDDAGFVINKLDPKNAKAFYRRGVALAKLGDYDKSLADLQQAANIDPNNALIKEELKKVLNVVIENRKKQAQAEKKEEPKKEPVPTKEPKKAPTVSEVSSTPAAKEPEKKSPKKPFKGKKISEEQISKAAALAAKALGKDYMVKPKTAYAFENVWRSHKNDYVKLYQFLRENVEPDYLATLFKENELPTEIYLAIIKTLNHELKEDNKEIALKYLQAMMKTKNAHINALMYKKEELKELEETFKSMEASGMDVKEIKKKYNM